MPSSEAQINYFFCFIEKLCFPFVKCSRDCWEKTFAMVCKFFLLTTCIWKFAQHPFIALNLHAGCGGYLEKLYKILVDILDLKAVYQLQIFPMKRVFSFDYSKIIKLKLLCETLKNEKKKKEFLLDIQTKCGDIGNVILNAAIDAEPLSNASGFKWLSFLIGKIKWKVDVFFRLYFKFWKFYIKSQDITTSSFISCWLVLSCISFYISWYHFLQLSRT